MNNSARRAGILLPLTALPGGGSLGGEAYAFVDFLVAAGQSVWQVLPVGPVGKSRSPYQSMSAFAGNPAFVDEKMLGQPLEEAVLRFDLGGADYQKFLRENAAWLDGFALFEAVHVRLRKPLDLWPDELRNPQDKTLAELSREHAEAVERTKVVQYFFWSQWKELKAYANLKGVGIVGDLPFYVSADSADFWLSRRAFDTQPDGRPASSAGVPPDDYAAGGQVWNVPVYAWGKRKKEVFALWRSRLAQAARLYDGVRIDHFRALADYYAYPAGGGEGAWHPGPGAAFIDMVKRDFPGLEVIAEDLGDLSDAAHALRAYSGFPGMKVLQFAFTGNADNPYLPHNIESNSVCYTGTHDNNTTVGYVRAASAGEAAFALRYLGLSGDRAALPGALLRTALMSRSETAIIPMQDWLGLGAGARMNKPATVGGRNWKWQLSPGALTGGLAARIRGMTEMYGR
ncbi:MAG: 4-alpha-glucanotransferase [Clostridiales Family XIII bacterium]|nr:4-alpha-glucanotransferase [Clostridiales Family XIII bacterium]